MKGIKPTSYLNNMIIYTNPQPARRKGDCCLAVAAVPALPGLWG